MSPRLRVKRAEPALARRQGAWIATIDPWRSLGYSAAGLARWLARSARARRVFVAVVGGDVAGVLVAQPDVLLGDFIALVAVRPDHAGKGVGRALVADAERRCFARHQWLYVSSDAANVDAARFYRRLGFRRVARLPDLVRAGRAEILWRKPRPA